MIGEPLVAGVVQVSIAPVPPLISVAVRSLTGSGRPRLELNHSICPATLNGSGTEATLAWTTPAANGLPITGYWVEYKDVTQTTWTRQAVPVAPVPTSATVTGLTPGQRYQYRVFAFTGNGGLGLVCPSSNLAVTGNQAPTATAVVTAPNPLTGEVTGLLTSVDSNNDSLTYRVSAWPTKGSVTWLSLIHI